MFDAPSASRQECGWLSLRFVPRASWCLGTKCSRPPVFQKERSEALWESWAGRSGIHVLMKNSRRIITIARQVEPFEGAAVWGFRSQSQSLPGAPGQWRWGDPGSGLARGFLLVPGGTRCHTAQCLVPLMTRPSQPDFLSEGHTVGTLILVQSPFPTEVSVERRWPSDCEGCSKLQGAWTSTRPSLRDEQTEAPRGWTTRRTPHARKDVRASTGVRGL